MANIEGRRSTIVGEEHIPHVMLADSAGVEVTPLSGAQFPASLGIKAAAASLSVTLATEDRAFIDGLEGFVDGLETLLITQAGYLDGLEALLTGPATGTQSNVADTASSTTILASNAARKGAMILNDSTVLLYLLVATGTASSTVHTVQMQPGAFYELPHVRGGAYTGIISGIWASNASGSARVTEYT